MENLILNSRWEPGPNGGPQYFSGNGSTYDALSINGYRTCSITRTADDPTYTSDNYDLPIDVRGQQFICWGYIIRAVEAQSIVLVANFYNAAGTLIPSGRHEITQDVTYQFSRQTGRFSIPSEAATARLSMVFNGTITACTYYAPAAYFC